MNFLMKIFGTGEDVPVTDSPEQVKKRFNSIRWRVFASITIGYAFYYIIRQGYSVIKSITDCDRCEYTPADAVESFFDLLR